MIILVSFQSSHFHIHDVRSASCLLCHLSSLHSFHSKWMSTGLDHWTVLLCLSHSIAYVSSVQRFQSGSDHHPSAIDCLRTYTGSIVRSLEDLYSTEFLRRETMKPRSIVSFCTIPRYNTFQLRSSATSLSVRWCFKIILGWRPSTRKPSRLRTIRWRSSKRWIPIYPIVRHSSLFCVNSAIYAVWVCTTIVWLAFLLTPSINRISFRFGSVWRIDGRVNRLKALVSTHSIICQNCDYSVYSLRIWVKSINTPWLNAIDRCRAMCWIFSSADKRINSESFPVDVFDSLSKSTGATFVCSSPTSLIWRRMFFSLISKHIPPRWSTFSRVTPNSNAIAVQPGYSSIIDAMSIKWKRASMDTRAGLLISVVVYWKNAMNKIDSVNATLAAWERSLIWTHVPTEVMYFSLWQHVWTLRRAVRHQHWYTRISETFASVLNHRFSFSSSSPPSILRCISKHLQP